MTTIYDHANFSLMPRFRGFIEYDVNTLNPQEAHQLHAQLIESLEELGLDCGDGDIWPVDGIEPYTEPPAGHPDVIEGSVAEEDDESLLQEARRLLSEIEDLDEQEAMEAWEKLFGSQDSATESSQTFDNVREITYTDSADQTPQNGSTMNLIETKSSTNGSSSSSSSTTTTAKPKALDRSQVEGLLSAVAAARLSVDSQARRTAADPLEQAELVKRLNDEYDEQEKTLNSILKRIAEAEDEGLEDNNAQNYGLFTVDANFKLSQRLDEIIRDAQHKMDEARDEAAAAIRACRDQLAEDGSPEVFSTDVRDNIYAECVRQGILAPYEPLEI